MPHIMQIQQFEDPIIPHTDKKHALNPATSFSPIHYVYPANSKLVSLAPHLPRWGLTKGLIQEKYFFA
jgi:hypothetical protein